MGSVKEDGEFRNKLGTAYGPLQGLLSWSRKTALWGEKKGINQAPDRMKQERAVSCQEAVGPLIASVAPTVGTVPHTQAQHPTR